MCKQGFTTRFKYAEHMVKVHSVVIDKPNLEKKDYKVVVHDETEDADLIANISVSDSLVEDLGKTLTCISDNTSNNIVEIVLTPSNNLTEHIITLPGNWLT